MSGESIYNVLQEDFPKNTGSYTGKYKKHMKEAQKPVYSTFFEKGKKYDGTHPRYFKQRDAIIGVSVSDSVDPKKFLRAGKGVRHVVPPVHERKLFIKPSLDNQLYRDHTLSAPGRRVEPFTDALLSNDQQKLPHEKNISESKDLVANGGPNVLEQHMYFNGEDRDLHSEFTRGVIKDGTGNGEAGVVQLQSTEDREFCRDQLTGDTNEGYCTFGGQNNYVRSNILQVSNMVPKRRKEQPENLTCRKTFGRVPLYLGRVKQEIDDEKKRLISLEESHIRQKVQQMKKYVYRLDEKERIALLNNLTNQLNNKNLELNKMPFAKDTFNQVLRRSELERSIKEIELSIAKLDKDAVFVYNDDPRFVNWTKNAALNEAASFASQ